MSATSGRNQIYRGGVGQRCLISFRDAVINQSRVGWGWNAWKQAQMNFQTIILWLICPSLQPRQSTQGLWFTSPRIPANYPRA